MHSSWIFVSAAFVISCSSSGGGASGAGGGTSATSDGATTSTAVSTASAQSSASGAGGAGSGGGGQGGGSPDTYANYADAFFVKYCVECHAAGAPEDFTGLAGITANAPNIRCGVAPTKEPNCGAVPAPKQFPISDAKGTNPKPTDAERARIVAWIDGGLTP